LAGFDRVVLNAPAQLRKGPHGAGCDRDDISDHVAASELAYARKLGIRLGSDLAASRAAIVEVLAAPSEGSPLAAKGWPPRYAARRIAWHVLDHAWEIEDKSKVQRSLNRDRSIGCLGSGGRFACLIPTAKMKVWLKPLAPDGTAELSTRPCGV
jgi:hypothetical protein